VEERQVLKNSVGVMMDDPDERKWKLTALARSYHVYLTDVCLDTMMSLVANTFAGICLKNDSSYFINASSSMLQSIVITDSPS